MVAVGLTVARVADWVSLLLPGGCCWVCAAVSGVVQVSSGKEKKVRAKERKEKTVLPAEFKVRVLRVGV